ncbi:MAG: hypothetical protein A3K30_03185 [Deltaproteobacteria bacterium RBG_13_51_10]|nr:MAG: hypothetical protein A3K30_03185 [Deltaproteobacteria bacterium RBG_13_51_10]
MSSPIQKFIERRFMEFFKRRRQGKINMWSVYVAGYHDGIKCAFETLKDPKPKKGEIADGGST